MATAGGPHPIWSVFERLPPRSRPALRAAAAAAKGLDRDGVLEQSAAIG
jgi:hypothetical protein